MKKIHTGQFKKGNAYGFKKGNPGSRGRVKTREEIEKIRSKLKAYYASHKKILSEEAKEKLREYYRKNKITPWNKGKKTKGETRLKMSISHIGKQAGANSTNWKGGITPENKRIRACRKMELWKKAVKERDGFACVLCGRSDGIIDVDHIVSFADILEKLRFEQGHDKVFEKSQNYELLWDINNGRTLCRGCHVKTDTYSGKQRIRLSTRG